MRQVKPTACEEHQRAIKSTTDVETDEAMSVVRVFGSQSGGRLGDVQAAGAGIHTRRRQEAASQDVRILA